MKLTWPVEVLTETNKKLHVVLLLGVSALVYANTLVNSFTFDDFPFILNNPAVRSASFRAFFEPSRVGNVFRPVSFATFSLNWKLENIHAFGYHLANVLLHAIVVVMLYFVLREVLEGVPRAGIVSLVAALLFAVHPIHSEAVASIANRPELLAAGFVFGAWLLHLRSWELPALACFVLGLLSKESAVAFVPLVIVGDYVRGKMKPISQYAWMVGLAALYVFVLWKAQGGRFGEIRVYFVDNPLTSLPWYWRIANALRISWKYVGLELYPMRLSADYSFNAVPIYKEWSRVLVPTVGALAVVGAWIWAVVKRQVAWAVAGMIYLAGFMVTSNILIATGTIMGERLAYLPSAGFCLVVVLLWMKLTQESKAAGWAVLMIVVAVLGARTVTRNRDWKSNYTLFLAAVRDVPESTKAHSNLGAEYMNQGKTELAIAEFGKALKIYPDMPDALEGYGIMEARQGHDEKALELLGHAVNVTPRDSTKYVDRSVNLAAMLVKVGRNNEALKVLNEVIAESPNYARAWANRAVIRYRRGEVESARRDAETALRLDPSSEQALNLLSALRLPTNAGANGTAHTMRSTELWQRTEKAYE